MERAKETERDRWIDRDRESGVTLSRGCAQPAKWLQMKGCRSREGRKVDRHMYINFKPCNDGDGLYLSPYLSPFTLSLSLSLSLSDQHQ